MSQAEGAVIDAVQAVLLDPILLTQRRKGEAAQRKT